MIILLAYAVKKIIVPEDKPQKNNTLRDLGKDVDRFDQGVKSLAEDIHKALSRNGSA